MFDAWAGLLISRPHHQLSAAPSVSQITVCRRHMARGRKKEAKANFSKRSNLFAGSVSDCILVSIRRWIECLLASGPINKLCICVTLCVSRFVSFLKPAPRD